MVLCRPELRYTVGAVASTHWLASAAGMSILERGGNAFDAAVATAFVLQVVEPHLNGPGGDVPIVLYDAGTGRVRVVCGQGPMPRAATPERFRELGLRYIPGSGLLPAVVPGVVGAWLRLLAEFGTLGVPDVLAPSIDYADGGFPLPPRAAETVAVLAPLFATEWVESGRTYLSGGAAPAPNARFRNPVLAKTYRRLASAASSARGREAGIEAAHLAFYQGFVAEAIDRFSRTAKVLDSTGRAHEGLLSGADLAAWRPAVEDPVSLDFRGYTVHKPGPWSQGPVFLAQLALLDGFDLSVMDPLSADYLHTVIECAKLAYADREAWYGDPDFTDVPLSTLLGEEYAGTRRRLVGDRASWELRPGTPDGLSPSLPSLEEDGALPEPPWQAQIHSGLPTVVQLTAARGDTCCLAVADRHGNLVAATPSGGWLKSSPVVPGIGFPLGTRGQMAWLEPGHPNSLVPGKRPRTTLSPTVVLRDGKPYVAFGTPGGDQQDQWTLRFFLAHAVHGLGLQAAAELPTFHTDHVPSSFTPRRSRPRTVVIERAFGEDVLERLRGRGHEIEPAADLSLGRVCAAGFEGRDGFVLAAASPRGEQAYAAGR